MVGTSKRITFYSSCVLILAIGCSVASAGTLDGHGDALAPIWTGSAPYSGNLGDFTGYVDYAVYTKADFIANFGTDDYNPVDGVVYTYQVFNTGTDNLSAKIVGNTAEANSIGYFDNVVGGDRAPTAYGFDGSNPTWTFVGNAVLTNESTYGLAFSSPYLPTFGGGFVIDGGGLTAVPDIPVPGSVKIPEPASVVLAGLSFLAFGWYRRRY